MLLSIEFEATKTLLVVTEGVMLSVLLLLVAAKLVLLDDDELVVVTPIVDEVELPCDTEVVVELNTGEMMVASTLPDDSLSVMTIEVKGKGSMTTEDAG